MPRTPSTSSRNESGTRPLKKTQLELITIIKLRLVPSFTEFFLPSFLVGGRRINQSRVDKDPPREGHRHFPPHLCVTEFYRVFFFQTSIRFRLEIGFAKFFFFSSINWITCEFFLPLWRRNDSDADVPLPSFTEFFRLARLAPCSSFPIEFSGQWRAISGRAALALRRTRVYLVLPSFFLSTEAPLTCGQTRAINRPCEGSTTKRAVPGRHEPKAQAHTHTHTHTDEKLGRKTR